MLLLSRIIGHDVRDPEGRVLGRLTDLTVSLAQPSGRHRVERMVVTCRRRQLLVPWDQVAYSVRDEIVVSSAAESSTGSLHEHEILLARDVLDTQVIDVVGQRLARVADVVLVRTEGGALELAGVDVGFGAVLRRLHLGALMTSTREDLIDWADVHLTSERGHAVALASPRAAVHHLDARGLAALISHLDTDSAAEVLAVKSPAEGADVVSTAHPAVGERVLRALPASDAARIVAEMPERQATPWRRRLEHPPAFLGRYFLRSQVWPRRRHRGLPS